MDYTEYFPWSWYSTANQNVGAGTHSQRFSESKVGTPLPGYKQIIKRGGNAMTNFSASRSKFDGDRSPSFKSTIKTGTFPFEQTYSWDGLLSPPSFCTARSVSLVTANNQAAQQFYSSANSALTSLGGMQVLGELRETIQLVRNPARSLYRSLQRYVNGAVRVRRSRSKTPRQKQAEIANMYLQGVFGWKPLISDIESAGKALNRIYDHPQIRRVSGHGSEKNHVSTTTGQRNINSVIRVQETVRDSTKAEIVFYGGVRANASGTRYGSVAEEFGGRLDLFVPTLWELLPWSFVADYFTNIGAIIESSCFSSSYLAWSGRTIRTTLQREYDCRTVMASNGKSHSGSCKWTVTETSVVRSKMQPPVPALAFTLPGQKQKWLNLAALYASSRK